ncbi:hypothetical protein, partial [Novosphingobium resinovorum]|uniref:hypothetical protein n=1 Tax=Novosphingobium resinovorum TaxID=158500 RepID=UPI002ED3FD11|nr:hypothetical protein [Novosphingobium resinovorum]
AKSTPGMMEIGPNDALGAPRSLDVIKPARFARNYPVFAGLQLRGRTPKRDALIKSEARALAFSKITYGKLGLAALMGIGLVWKKSLETDVLQGWGMIWLLMGGGLVLLAAVQVLRKWRFSQQQSSK